MRRKKEKCVAKEGCKRTDITGFGLCKSHYQKIKRKVDLGRDTWEAAIERGDAIPSKTFAIKATTKK